MPSPSPSSRQATSRPRSSNAKRPTPSAKTASWRSWITPPASTASVDWKISRAGSPTTAISTLMPPPTSAPNRLADSSPADTPAPGSHSSQKPRAMCSTSRSSASKQAASSAPSLANPNKTGARPTPPPKPSRLACCGSTKWTVSSAAAAAPPPTAAPPIASSKPSSKTCKTTPRASSMFSPLTILTRFQTP